MHYDVNRTIGHVLRRAPSKGGHGLEATLIDMAQDLLLRHLDERGVIDDRALKDGTASRKVLCGNPFDRELPCTRQFEELDNAEAAMALGIEPGMGASALPGRWYASARSWLPPSSTRRRSESGSA